MSNQKNKAIHDAIIKKHKKIQMIEDNEELIEDWMFVFKDELGNPLEISRAFYLGIYYEVKDILTFDEFCVEFTLLEKLQTLDISLTEKVTSIPKEIGNMYNLKQFCLTDCKSNFEMPDEFYKLTNLTGLAISESEGIIVDLQKICTNMINLEYLILETIGFKGEIPKEIGNLTKLYELSLCDNNYMKGKIPDEILKLTNLNELNLSDSNLEGDNFLEKLCESNLDKIHTLILTNSGLTGIIPKNINKFKMKFLWIDNNELTGEIPITLSEVCKYKDIRISNNKFLGKIPQKVLKFIEDI